MGYFNLPPRTYSVFGVGRPNRYLLAVRGGGARRFRRPHRVGGTGSTRGVPTASIFFLWLRGSFLRNMYLRQFLVGDPGRGVGGAKRTPQKRFRLLCAAQRVEAVKSTDFLPQPLVQNSIAVQMWATVRTRSSSRHTVQVQMQKEREEARVGQVRQAPGRMSLGGRQNQQTRPRHASLPALPVHE